MNDNNEPLSEEQVNRIINNLLAKSKEESASIEYNETVDDMLAITNEEEANDKAGELFINYVNTKREEYFDNLIALLENGYAKKIEALKQFDDVSIFYKTINGKTFLEYLLDKDIKFSYDINKSICNNIELFRICYDLGKYRSLLTYMRGDILLEDLHGMSVIETIISSDLNNIVYVLNHTDEQITVDLLMKYDRKRYFRFLNEETLFRAQINGKSAIEYFFENGLADIINIPEIEKHVEIVKLIIDNNRLDLLNELDDKILTNKNSEGKTIAEVLASLGYKLNKIDVAAALFECENGKLLIDKLIELGNNVEEITRSKYISEEIVLKLYEIAKKYNRLDYLSNLSNDNYLIKLENGNTLIEDLLSHDRTFNFKDNLYKEETLPILLKFDRFDMISKYEYEDLLKSCDINNTYLDLLLQRYNDGLSNDIKSDLIGTTISNEIKAKVYLTYAKYGLARAIKSLDKNALFKEENGKKLIDILFEMDQDLTLSKLLTSGVKEDLDVSIYLKLKGIKQNEVKFESIIGSITNTRDTKEKYIDDYYNEYNFLSNERYESLLNELRSLMSDGNSSEELIDVMINSYRHYMYTTNDIREVMHLINIKRNSSNFRLQQCEAGAYYRNSNNTVYMDDRNPDTFDHEIGHALAYNLLDDNVYDEGIKHIDEIAKRLRNSDEFMDKLKEYVAKLKEIRKQVEQIVDDIYIKEFDESIDENVRDKVRWYVNQNRQDMMETYLRLDVDRELLETVLGEMYTEEEYISQVRRIKREELFDIIIRTEYGNFTSIGDYFDGIFEGKVHSSLLKDKDNNEIGQTPGHGYDYYHERKDKVFDEMIANYSETIKSKKPDEGLEMLRYYIGDEIVDYISEFYQKQIVESKRYEESVVLGG